MANFVNADISINEFLANGIIEPDNEWVELFNNQSSSVDLTGYNISEGTSKNITLSVTIPANGFIVLVENFTLFNSTFPNLNSTGLVVDYGEVVPSFQLANNKGNISLYDSTGAKISNISYSIQSEDESFGRFPDGSNTTYSTFTALTPGDNNDNAAPIFNKWVNPFANNSIIGGLFNVTVNITDVTHTVNISLINFNNSNFSMTKTGDLWYFVWNTSLNAETFYNITIFFNDSVGLSNTDNTLFNITVDNTKPNITAPVTSANSRNYVNPGFNFNASVNVTDTNLLNVTCTLGSTTVANFSNDGNTYYCNLTSALITATQSNLEQDFEITFT